MEEIYPPESYGASAHFPLKEYFEKFSQVFSSEIFLTHPEIVTNETDYLLTIKTLMDMDLSYNDIKHLSQICSIDHLTCENEDIKNFPLNLPEHINSTSKLPCPLIETDSNNLMVNKCLLELETQKTSNQLCLGTKRHYHKRLDFPVPTTPTNLQPGSEFVVSILVYKPIAFGFFNAKNTSEKLKFHHEIQVLGCNTLAEFRKTIICSADSGLCKEVENTTADLTPLANARLKYPSGFLFIDNVFYNDFSDLEAIDYSLPILQWAKGKEINNLKSEDMDNVTIRDLTPRFGYPYVYMHQGDCEHLFVFADAKLLDNDDCLHSQCYPHVLKIYRKTSKICFMCTVSSAKWICVGSDRLPQHKVFLCTSCCNAYNYIHDKKLGNFKLYPYYEQNVL